jgi:hypothetical protein
MLSWGEEILHGHFEVEEVSGRSCWSGACGWCWSRVVRSQHVAADLGVGAETLRKRVRQSEADSGRRTDLLTRYLVESSQTGLGISSVTGVAEAAARSARAPPVQRTGPRSSPGLPRVAELVSRGRTQKEAAQTRASMPRSKAATSPCRRCSLWRLRLEALTSWFLGLMLGATP